MAVNLSSVIAWATTEAVDAPEPLVLLVLGALFIALSFGVRRRNSRDAAEPAAEASRAVGAVTVTPKSRTNLAAASGTLATHEAR